jgi:hypothetical protein
MGVVPPIPVFANTMSILPNFSAAAFDSKGDGGCFRVKLYFFFVSDCPCVIMFSWLLSCRFPLWIFRCRSTATMTNKFPQFSENSRGGFRSGARAQKSS